MFEIFNNVFFGLIDAILLYLFVGLFLCKRDLMWFNKILTFSILVLFYVASPSFIDASFERTILFFICDILFCFILFKDKWYRYVVNIGLFYILQVIIEALTLSFVNIFTDIDVTQFSEYYEISTSLIILLMRSINFIAILLIKIFMGRSVKQKPWQILLLVPLITVIFVWFIYNRFWGIGNSDIDKLLAYVGIFLVIQNVFVFFYVISLQNSAKQYTEMKSAYERQVQYSNTITSIQKAIRKMAHDIRHHFIYLRSALDQEDIPKAKAYLTELDENLENIIPLNVTGHYDVDALLHAKASIAEKLNILIRVEGTLPPELMISPIDLSALLGNSIDNAIESASRIEGQKEITIAFYNNASRLNYTISNPYNGQLQKKPDGYYVSQKGSGLGFEIMDEVVKKYGGALLTESNENDFKLTVMLQTPQS